MEVVDFGGVRWFTTKFDSNRLDSCWLRVSLPKIPFFQCVF